MKKIFLSFLLILSVLGIAQSQSIEMLENTIDNYYGKEKLEILLQLTEHYIDIDPKKAVRFGKQAQDLADNIITSGNTLISEEDYYFKPKSSLLLGKAYFEREQYLEAKQAFIKAKNDVLKIDLTAYDTEIEEFLARLDVIASENEKAVEGNFFKKKLGNLGIGEIISESSGDVAINSALKNASDFEKIGEYTKAVDSYQKAINLLRNKGDSKKITEIRERIGDVYVMAGQYDEALNNYALVRQDFSKLGDSLSIYTIQQKIDQTITVKNARKSLPDKVEKNLAASSKIINTKIDSLNFSQKKTQSELMRIAQKLEQEQDYKKSLEYYKLYTELQNKYIEEEQAKELAWLEQDRIQQEVILLKQDHEISQLQIAQSEANLIIQKKFKNNLLYGSILLLALALTLYLLYKNKKKDHQKLQLAYDDLDILKSQLESAEKKIKTLLHQQVSGAVAQELLKDGFSNAIEERFVCIMFLDIRDFTPFAETKKPEEIIQYQNDVFGFMIDIVEKHHGVINQLLGDGFMATFGAPVSNGNDCQNAVNAAQQIVKTLQDKLDKKEIPVTKIGIGLHAGNVVTGNVGTEERKQYSITGNTVIIAARIEQLTKTLNSQVLISKEVFEKLNDKKTENDFVEMPIKGRNEPISVLRLA